MEAETIPNPDPEGTPEAVPAPPPPPDPDPALTTGLSEDRKRELLGAEDTPAQAARRALRQAEERHFLHAVALDHVDAEDSPYPEEIRPIHRKRLHGALLMAEADVEQYRAQLEAAEAAEAESASG